MIKFLSFKDKISNAFFDQYNAAHYYIIHHPKDHLQQQEQYSRITKRRLERKDNPNGPNYEKANDNKALTTSPVFRWITLLLLHFKNFKNDLPAFSGLVLR